MSEKKEQQEECRVSTKKCHGCNKKMVCTGFPLADPGIAGGSYGDLNIWFCMECNRQEFCTISIPKAVQEIIKNAWCQINDEILLEKPKLII